MNTILTFAMIKPDVVMAKQVGEVITQIEQNGFDILEMQLLRLTLEQAQAFYAVHQSLPFYQELCTYMSSGSVIVMCLEKENAVSEFRKLIGATNPAEAAPGTIRQRFGKSLSENAIHGSDSPANAIKELDFFFSCCDSSCGCCCQG
jgi:nucleoside-diphosphate kinase